GRQLRHRHRHVQRDDDPERRREVVRDRARDQRHSLEAALERLGHLEAGLDAEDRPDRPRGQRAREHEHVHRDDRGAALLMRARVTTVAVPIATATLALGTAAWAANGRLPLLPESDVSALAVTAQATGPLVANDHEGSAILHA